MKHRAKAKKATASQTKTSTKHIIKADKTKAATVENDNLAFRPKDSTPRHWNGLTAYSDGPKECYRVKPGRGRRDDNASVGRASGRRSTCNDIF